MPSFSKTSLLGYLARDGEAKYTPQGTAMVEFTIGVTDRRKDKSGEWQDVSSWFRCTLWGTRAESIAPKLTKGSLVFVEGNLSPREFTDRDGNQRTSLDVRVNDVTIVSSKEVSRAVAASDSAPSSVNTSASEPVTDDDILF